MRRFVAVLMLCLPAAAQAEELCGRGDAANGSVKMAVIITNAGAGTHTPYVNVTSSNPDGSYGLSVHYRPTKAGLGPPVGLSVRATVPLPVGMEPEPHQIEWRSGSGEWFNPGYWDTPERSLDRTGMGIANYRIAQGEPIPYRTELLDQLGRGTRLEFRSLDRDGDVVSSGSVDYPAPEPIIVMYNAAKAQAIAGLSPCGPPLIIRPAPRPATERG